MVNRRLLIVASVVLLVGLAGCTSGGSPGSASSSDEIESGEIHEAYFAGDGVACYAYEWGESGGLDCSRVDEKPSEVELVVDAGEGSANFDRAGQIHRQEYTADNRVCYAYEWGESGGLACVPLEEE